MRSFAYQCHLTSESLIAHSRCDQILNLDVQQPIFMTLCVIYECDDNLQQLWNFSKLFAKILTCERSKLRKLKEDYVVSNGFFFRERRLRKFLSRHSFFLRFFGYDIFWPWKFKDNKSQSTGHGVTILKFLWKFSYALNAVRLSNEIFSTQLSIFTLTAIKSQLEMRKIPTFA